MNSLSIELPDYKDIITRICNEADSSPGALIDKWMELTDIVSIIRYNDNLAGFSLAARILKNQNLIYVPATFVSNEYQNKGLASKLWLTSLKSVYKPNIISIFKPVYFIFRTQTPKLYAILRKKIKIYPSLDNDKPNAKEKEMVITAANKIWPGKEINTEELIIIDSVIDTPDILPNPEDIKWSGNQAIDDFFEKKLHLTNRGMDDFLVLGKIRFGFLLMFAR